MEIRLKPDERLKTGSLVLVFGASDVASAKPTYKAIGVNETSYAYLMRAPSLRHDSAKRLDYFAVSWARRSADR